MYLITQEALTHEEFLTICDTREITIPATNLSEPRILRNTNYLISPWNTRGYLNSDAHGVKTGSTSEAGHCLVSTALRGSLSFLSVVLNGDRRTLEDGEIRTYSFYDTNQLFRWGIENFAYQTVLKAKDPVQEVPVSLSKQDWVTVRPAHDVDALLPNDLPAAVLAREITLLSETAGAPLVEGEVLGSLCLRYPVKESSTGDLPAVSRVEAARS